MSKKRELGWRAFLMLLMIGIFAWGNWPLIKKDYNDPQIESLFYLVIFVGGLLVLFLLVVTITGWLNQDPLNLSAPEEEPKEKKRLTRKERQALQKRLQEDREFDKLF